MKYIAIALSLAMASAVKIDPQDLSQSTVEGVGENKATVWDAKNPHPGYPAYQNDFNGHWDYNRVAPFNFQGPGTGDDQFMNSIIMKYSVE